MEMIQVIKNGNSKRAEAVCNECGCRFSFGEHDEECDEMSGKSYVTCPDCGRRFRTPVVRVKESNGPSMVGGSNG